MKTKNFRQTHFNIKIHKIFLYTIIIINIILIIFILVYKSKISDIKLKSNFVPLNLGKNLNNITSINDSFHHKLVNIFAISLGASSNYHFSLIFETSEEVRMAKEFVNTYKIVDHPYLLLIYQGHVDSDKSSIIFDIIKYYTNTLTIVQTKTGEKFGFFFDGAIIPNKQGFFESNNHKCLIFSFQDKEKYYCNLKNKTFEVNKDNFFNIGDGDIEIKHNYHKYGGKINFPFKTFNIPENKDNIFKKINGKFDIKDIEIYGVIDENYDYYDLRRIIFS